MNLYQKKVIMIGSGIICIGVWIGVFFLYYVPAIQQAYALQDSLHSEQIIVKALQKQKVQEGTEVKDTASFQKQLPVEPMVEMAILDIRQAEKRSDCSLSTITLVDEASKGTTTMPNDLKKLVFNVTVQAPTYEAFQNFIQTIEEQTRIAKVEKVTINAQNAMTKKNVQPSLSVTCTIVTYYLPSLSNLKEKDPTFTVPKGCQRINPFTEEDCK